MNGVSGRRSERGATAIEMAIVAPAFLLFIFAIIEVALWMHARDIAQAAAREGVSELRVVDPGSQAGAFQGSVEAAAEDYARRLGDIQDPVATSTYDEASGRVTVILTGEAIDLIPGWDLSVSGSASGLIETFRPDFGENGDDE